MKMEKIEELKNHIRTLLLNRIEKYQIQNKFEFEDYATVDIQLSHYITITYTTGEIQREYQPFASRPIKSVSIIIGGRDKESFSFNRSIIEDVSFINWFEDLIDEANQNITNMKAVKRQQKFDSFYDKFIKEIK